jgi:hypothetical protein
MLWTEDWFKDRMDNRWSYHAARMRSVQETPLPFLSEPFLSQNDHFAKTGLGQT